MAQALRTARNANRQWVAAGLLTSLSLFLVLLFLNWRNEHRGIVAPRGSGLALSAMAEYGDSLVGLFLNLPVVAMWGLTIVALLKVGWIVLRRTVLLFFPGLATRLLRPVESRAT